MAESLTIDALKGAPAAYDKYFTALSQGTPEKLTLPEEFTAKDLAELLEGELSDPKLLPEEINDLLDCGKIGFTLLKFSKAGKPKWCCGVKLTGELYYPPEESKTEEPKSDSIAKTFI